MIFDKLKNIDPQKIAITYNNESFSYGFLVEKIKHRAAWLSGFSKDLLFCHQNELENLINFLAAISIGKKGVFGGKNLTSEQKKLYAKSLKLQLIDVDFNESLPTIMFVNTYKPNDKDLFLGVLTSGTSGTPKLIWKDYQAWFSAFEYQSSVFNISESDHIFVLDALAYSANLNAVLHGLWSGATLYLGKLQEAKYWNQQFDSHSITSTFLVPSHLRLLVNSTEVLPKVASLVTAGEKLDQKTAQLIINKCPNATLTEYYGTAELGHITYHQNEAIINCPNAVGKPFPGVEVSIIDGKIWSKSPYVSPAFRAKPTVNDYGQFDALGNLIVLGREGRMFNKRGLNVFAEEIENTSNSHPFITESLVKQNSLSQKIELYYVLQDSKKLSKKALKEFLLTKLPKSKLPNFLYQLPYLPRGTTGKIDIKSISKSPVEEDSVQNQVLL